MYLLYKKLGVSAVIGASCCIVVMSPLQFYLGKKMSENSKEIARWCDERLQKTNEMLQDFRVLKLTCWEMQFCERINDTRKKELKVLDKESLYWALMTFLTHCSSALISLVTLISYYHLESIPLTPANVFSALALFNQLTVPLFIFPITVPIIITAINSTRRLEEFLALTEVTNVIPDYPTESNNNKERSSKIPSEESVHKMGDDGCWGEGHGGPGPHVLTIREASFSWAEDASTPSLRVQHLTLPSSKLTAVIGKVGSGKSSLLKAILGEMKCAGGYMKWESGVKVAYVSQQAWMLNATVRDNIVLGLPVNQRRLARVVSASALQSDLEALPLRDLTEIGDRGVNLSGGQRQRIAIARALYARANVLILDDPLSALDSGVAHQVFEEGIMKLVTKHAKTVIMVTHSLHLLTNAHQILVVEEGEVRGWGQVSEVETGEGRRSARDRWHLIRLLSRVGHRIRHNPPRTISKPVFVPVSKRLSRRWVDDYWREELRLVGGGEAGGEVEAGSRGRRRPRPVARATSLQPHPSPHLATVTRQASSPTINQPNRSKTYTFDGEGGNLLRQIFSPARQVKADAEWLHSPPIRDRNVIKRLIPPPFVRHTGTGEKSPIQRLPSTCSDCSDDFRDDDEEEEREWYSSNPSEERQYGKIPWEIYLKYAKACGLWSAGGYLVLSIGWQALRVYTDFWLSEWTSSSSSYSQSEAVRYLEVYTWLSLGTVVVALASSLLGQLAGALARRSLHQALINAVLRLPVLVFEALPVSRILARFSTDITIIDKKLCTSIQRLVQFLLLCLPAILVNSVITPWFLILAIPLCLLYFYIQKFYRTSSRELNRLESLARTPMISHLNETLIGLETIRAFKQQEKFLSTMFSKINVHTNAFLIIHSANRWLSISLDYLGGVIVAGAMLVSLVCWRLMPELVDPAVVGLALNYTLLVPIYLNWVVKFVADVETHAAAVERIHYYTKLPPEDYKQKCVMYYGWPQRGEIRFQNVTIKYGLSHDAVINNLNLHIPPGQKVGVCGKTGCGKSSLVMSLFGVAPVTEGLVLIDDVDISRLPLCLLRSRLSIIPQDVILYTGTIRENLDLSKCFTDAELWSALEVAQMKEVVATQLGGLDGVVREGGSNLSGGQRQLVCLARAVLHNAAVLVMDEATSSLDSATEHSLLQLAHTAFTNRTVISIAHRVSTLVTCDRVLVLEGGHVVEDGPPRELLSRSLSLFSTMLRNSQHPSTLK